MKIRTKTNALMIEFTRRCNMKCKHCLRGDCQNVDIDFETIKSAIDQFEQIDSITFTGGEPTLCGDMIEKTVDYIIDNHKNVGGFYMATNGKDVNLQTMFALTRLYAYICDMWGCDDYNCSVDISTDNYHDTISLRDNALLHAFSFVRERGEIHPEALIKEGRAYENGLGRRLRNHYSEFSIIDDDKFGDERHITYEMVYVNAKGNILPDCDFSYETQDYLSDINIKSGKIYDLANRYNDMLASK